MFIQPFQIGKIETEWEFTHDCFTSHGDTDREENLSLMMPDKLTFIFTASKFAFFAL